LNVPGAAIDARKSRAYQTSSSNSWQRRFYIPFDILKAQRPAVEQIMSDLDRLHQIIDALPPRQIHALLALLNTWQPVSNEERTSLMKNWCSGWVCEKAPGL